jgi:tRNA pseudouridine55 synthase
MKRTITGVLLLDKPQGISSQKAVTRVKNIYRAAKGGHTGSLDPLATGVLPICLGEATKCADYLLTAQKTYQVTAQLGQTTDTGDAEGEIIIETLVTETMLSQIDSILPNFTGVIQQIPPMYSAIKHRGQPLYKMARRGVVIERSARDITIYELQRLPNKKPNQLTLRVACSKGTYIRTLVEDIGQALGCGAHVLELRRLQVHNYSIEQTVSYESIQHMSLEALDELLLPITSLVYYLPKATISVAVAPLVKNGIPVDAEFNCEDAEGKWQILTEAGEFLGLGERTRDNKIAPKRLLVGQ